MNLSPDLIAAIERGLEGRVPPGTAASLATTMQERNSVARSVVESTLDAVADWLRRRARECRIDAEAGGEFVQENIACFSELWNAAADLQGGRFTDRHIPRASTGVTLESAGGNHALYYAPESTAAKQSPQIDDGNKHE